jgi:hypothetical protein
MRAREALLLLGVLAGSLPLRAASRWEPMSDDTVLQKVCPPNGFGGSGYAFSDSCHSVTEEWGGGAMDITGNRLILWGGGHGSYKGNELYALDFNDGKMKRLTDPGLPLVGDVSSAEAVAGGTQPNSRHPYGGMAFMENMNRLYISGGSLAPTGSMSYASWTFDLSVPNGAWRREADSSEGNQWGHKAAYDRSSGRVFVQDSEGWTLRAFDGARYEVMNGEDEAFVGDMTSAIDPDRKILVLIGGSDSGNARSGLWAYDLKKPKPLVRIPISGTHPAVIHSDGPGIDYDTRRHRFAVWNGGDTVYTLAIDTTTWRATWGTATAPGSPALPRDEQGTLGRWRYVPSKDAFATVNRVSDPAVLFYFDDSAPLPAPARPRRLRLRP